MLRVVYVALGVDDAIRFNGHPPLGVNATRASITTVPTRVTKGFNGHPPLGVNATYRRKAIFGFKSTCFNGHPPLGVNATHALRFVLPAMCKDVSMGTHPWG